MSEAEYVAAARAALARYNAFMAEAQQLYTDNVRDAREQYLVNTSWWRPVLKRRFPFVRRFTARERELLAIADARLVYDRTDAVAWAIYADAVRPFYEERA